MVLFNCIMSVPLFAQEDGIAMELEFRSCLLFTAPCHTSSYYNVHIGLDAVFTECVKL